MKISLHKILYLLAYLALFTGQAKSQQLGDFRSAASGSWSNSKAMSTWQQFQVIGGASWKITAQSDISGVTGNTISQASYAPGGSWKNATVPATVLTSYVNNGTLPEPNTNLNIYNINKATYNKPYWYRATFTIPASFSGRTVWLNFDGTNKKADIYLNGTLLGTNLGHVARKKYKFTPVSGTNCIAVLVSTPTFSKGSHDLANLESPTYICSQGWDWMPQVPGLNCGITDDVYLSSSTSVTIEDPWIRPQLPAPYTTATLNIRAQLMNNTGASVTGNWTGTITPGGQTFTVNNVTIPANSSVNGNTNVTISNPDLWWPNGYGGNADGTQKLYKCYMEFKIGTTLSDSATRAFGIRNVTWNKNSNSEPLKVTVNGQPVFCKGGNWGMSEYLLRSRGSAYDTRVKLHQQMNFNMIRNWTGETTDDEFYDACDKYGIMVFDDFWLHNSNWINDADTVQFRNNVVEKIKKVRNHASLVLWCGANEGVPGYTLTSKESRIMTESIATTDLNDHWYLPRSNNRATAGVGPYLSGSGSWLHEHPAYYFLYPANGFTESATSYSFRTEIGSAVVPNAESIRKFITNASDQWPAGNLWDNNMWKFHMFGKADSLGWGAGAEEYVKDINRLYGTSSNLDQFTKRAQLINLETNKAIFEGWQDRLWNDATGVLLWMSQSAYPSMIWQTYDYYFDLTGAYFGAKSGCEPSHIQWNAATNSVKYVNNTNYPMYNMKAEAIVYDKAGKVLPGYYQNVTMLATAASTSVEAFKLFGTLLSAGKPVTASSSQGSYPASNVTDGRGRTRWAANGNGTGEWIQVDLGSNQNVNNVRILWEAAYSPTYKIQTATASGGPWTDAITVNNSGGVNNVRFNTVNCRYVRMQPTASPVYAHSLWEFEVFGPVVNNVATLNKDISASSTQTGFTLQAANDANAGTRWSSNYGSDNENITIDMGTSLPVTGTKIVWEAAYATSYKIQVSNSLSGPWTDAITVTGNAGGTDTRTFSAASGRYVRMQGLTRSLASWGYSIWEFEVYTRDPAPLTDVSFIKLKLTDPNNFVLSENFYWYGSLDYKGINTMPGIGASLTKSGATVSTLSNGNTLLTYTITNTSTSNAAFAIRAQLLNGSGQQILPAFFSDSYFSLMQGESKQLKVEVNPTVLGGTYSLDLKPFNP